MLFRSPEPPPPVVQLPRILLAYHFFHPDEVVSARLFSDLAVGLVHRGWDVTALTSDRSWDVPAQRYPEHEQWRGVTIERARRPAWDQRRPAERLLNSAWMIGAWLARARRMRAFDVVIIGSDPAFAPVLFLPLRRLWSNAVLAHWCYDVYPDAVAADGGGLLVRVLMPAARALMGASYRCCDAVVDLGPRMRDRLSCHPTDAVRETLVPWALTAPPAAPRRADASVREGLFGDAKLALLYSGTLGRAHDFAPLLALARASRARYGRAVAFCFSSRGAGIDELRRCLTDADTNVRIVPFGAEDELERRLESADIHLLSLREAWSGVVVPSKFFGSLAVGRPVLYSGPSDSDIAHWIRELDVGWAMSELGIAATLDLLGEMALRRDKLETAQRRARAAYDTHFGKDVVIDRWDSLLRALVARRGGERATDPAGGPIAEPR